MPNVTQKVIEHTNGAVPKARTTGLVIEYTDNKANIARCTGLVIEVANGVKPCNWVDEAQSDIGFCF